MGDSNVYTAERILAKRKLHGVTQYHIKWKGYSLKDSTWEPAENILDRSLLIHFEQTRRNNHKSSTSATHSTPTTNSSTLNSSGTSSNSSSLNESKPAATSTIGKVSARGRGRPRKKSYTEQRREQLELQRHIEQQQQQKTHSGITTASLTSSSLSSATITTSTAPTSLTQNGDKKLIIFNPQGNQEHTVVEEIVYEPELTKEPILVTDVTSKDLTVTISECRTPDGFFRT